MCDDAGISRDPHLQPLTGLPAGESKRRTNWDELSEYANVSREAHLLECERIIAASYAWPGELLNDDPTEHREGSRRQVVVNAYERDPTARQKCIEYYGAACVDCGFSFLDAFGPEAEGFIHVHHLTPLAKIGHDYAVDPMADLRPVCPNCHAVIHLGGGNRSIEQVKENAQQLVLLKPTVGRLTKKCTCGLARS